MQRDRPIGPVLATALVASNMVGSGIFLLPATLASVGSITIIGWAISTLGALLIGIVLAKLGQVAPLPGGPIAYAGRAFGPYFGFQSSTVYWLSCWFGNIAIAVAAVGYLSDLVPIIHGPVRSAVATVGLIWLMTFVNILGPRLLCQFESIAIVLGLIPILLVATVGWWYFDRTVFVGSWNPSAAPPGHAIRESLVSIFWAFSGLESASVVAAVVRNPRRDVPIATIAGVSIAGLIYTTACTAVFGLIPAAKLAQSSAPFADAVHVIFGPLAAGAIALMAMTKTLGTLGGWVLLTAQTGKAAADRGHFPAIFGRVDGHGIPVRSYILMAGVMSVVVFATMSPTLGRQFETLIDVSVLLALLVYMYACLALIRFERWQPDARELSRYRLEAVLAFLFCVVVAVYSEGRLLAWALALVALTLPFYIVKTRAWRRAPAAV